MCNLASIICIRTLYASLTTYMLTTDKCLIQQKEPSDLRWFFFAEYFIIYVWSFASKKVDFLKYNLFKVPLRFVPTHM